MKSVRLLPNILEETSRGIQAIGIEDSLLKTREIFLTTEVDSDSSADLLKQLIYLERVDEEKPITLYISSPGGEVTSGLAVYDYIRMMKSKVITVCIGTAASMGAILFLAGDERKMLPHTKIMIHDPSYGNASMGGMKPLEIRDRLDGLMQSRKLLAEIIAERSGMNLKKVYEKTRRDSFLNAKEAIKIGIATEILERGKKYE
ncbi:MAG: ClpP family protease [Catonella sp.]|uniref:ClpP family protease n=1 Tax=Catonella sp. TaxID=2382125 RepID=UPI003FA09649